jgi:hypothetical protein
VIEQMGAEGQPTVLVDHTAQFLAMTKEFNKAFGWGCNGVGAPAGGIGAGLIGLLALARRRR